MDPGFSAWWVVVEMGVCLMSEFTFRSSVIANWGYSPTVELLELWLNSPIPLHGCVLVDMH